MKALFKVSILSLVAAAFATIPYCVMAQSELLGLKNLSNAISAKKETTKGSLAKDSFKPITAFEIQKTSKAEICNANPLTPALKDYHVEGLEKDF